MKINPQYCCTEIKCKHAPLFLDDNWLRCPDGHLFPFKQDTKIPIFACEPKNSNEYSLENAALIHDNSLRWVFSTFGIEESSLREKLVSRLSLKKGQKILVTGAGAGNDLPYIARALGSEGVIYAQDISEQMIQASVDRFKAAREFLGVDIFFSVSDATNLPFADNVFDSSYHFGGINLFSNIQTGIFEMNRVVKSGGRVLISDEGIAPWLKETEFGKMLIKNNPLYTYDAPLALLPSTAKSVNLSWELSNCFYVIDFTVSDKLPRIDIDVPHIGKRGGSIRKRYFGQLEGIDPELRDRIYADAEKVGFSRSEYVEMLLKKSSENN